MQRDNQCNGLKVGIGVACLKNNKETRVVRVERENSKNEGGVC